MNKYYIYDYSILKNIEIIDALDTIVVVKHYPLQRFSSFKVLKLEDINNLRIMLFNDIEIDDSWLESILRFLEIRMFEINKRLSLNYESYNQMVVFKDCVISFLLEAYYYNNDFRFLNTALKLMNVKFKFFSKQSLYNKKLCDYLKMSL